MLIHVYICTHMYTYVEICRNIGVHIDIYIYTYPHLIGVVIPIAYIRLQM
jgi:hypothetical protein